MLNKSTVQLMALGLIGSMAATSFADDSALIDALVRKGVLKKGEAEQIRAQACKDCASDKLSGKVSLGESVKQLNLTGDVLMRYQYGSADAQHNAAPSANVSQISQFRYRLRINADYTVDENFFAGFGLSTQDDRRTADQNLANNYYQNDPITISRAFLGWKPVEDVTLIGGKHEIPFYTTDMVWASDVNPTGFTQQINLNKVFGFSGVELTLNSGQFVVADNNEYDSAHQDNRDAFVWQTQLVASAEVASGVKLTVAPGFYSSNGAKSGQTDITYRVDPNTGNPIDHLENMQIILAPGDISTELLGKKFKVQWDFAYNLDGSNRSMNQVGRGLESGTDNMAWLAGIQIGENKKKGDWSAVANYRKVGLAAVDNLISDSSWAGGTANMSGFKFGVAYNIGNATTLEVNYYQADNIRKSLGAVNEVVSPANNVQLIQADVSVKF